MKRQLVYIAGPYRSKEWGKFGIIRNILHARNEAIKLWQQGYATICPHLNSALMPGKPELFLEGDLKILRHCDAIYMLKGWEKSEGARAELVEARKRGLKVWYENGLTESLPYKVEPQEAYSGIVDLGNGLYIGADGKPYLQGNYKVKPQEVKDG